MTMTGAIMMTISTDMYHRCGPRVVFCAATSTGMVFIGIAGVQGSGHGQLLRAIAGVDPVSAGEVRVDGKRVASDSPRAAYAKGVLLVPAARRGAAIVPRQSIRENILLSGRIRRGADASDFAGRSPNGGWLNPTSRCSRSDPRRRRPRSGR
jgi:ABC-type proline/glycine betaine transport system ATPase subunit